MEYVFFKNKEELEEIYLKEFNFKFKEFDNIKDLNDDYLNDIEKFISYFFKDKNKYGDLILEQFNNKFFKRNVRYGTNFIYFEKEIKQDFNDKHIYFFDKDYKKINKVIFETQTKYLLNEFLELFNKIKNKEEIVKIVKEEITKENLNFLIIETKKLLIIEREREEKEEKEKKENRIYLGKTNLINLFKDSDEKEIVKNIKNKEIKVFKNKLNMGNKYILFEENVLNILKNEKINNVFKKQIFIVVTNTR